MNAHSLPNTFTLILSKNNSACRPARVKWRSDTEVGAEFFKADFLLASRLTADARRANPSSASRLIVDAPKINSAPTSRLTADAPKINSAPASRLTADAPRALKSREGEDQKSEKRKSTLSVRTPAQQPDVAKLKVDRPQVARSVGGDKAKTEVYCEITDIGGQVGRTDQGKNSKKRLDLSRLQKKLGPKHVALIHALKDVDPESPLGRELASIVENLGQTCD